MSSRAKDTHRPRRLQDEPGAPKLPQPECGSTAGAAADEPGVLDDLPELVPVTGPELDVIEIYLGSLIDGLLTDAGSEGAVTPSSTSNPGTPIRGSRPRS